MVQWFTEQEQELARYGYSFDKELFNDTSPFQKVQVIETRAYGRMLIIDGCIMLTDADEFVYHEMIAHVPVCYHKDPKTVIVIGGGDGGTVRELLRHPTIEKIILCEIDEMVVNASKQFFPAVAGCLDDPRVEVRIGDGIAYMKELESFADIILVDSTDPFGPGEGLFSKEFYRSVNRALKPGGIMAAQSESPWASPESLQRIYNNIAGGFSHIMPYTAPIPTYPRGYWSWTMAADRQVLEEGFQSERFSLVADTCKFLTEEYANTTFVLPRFYREKLGIR